MRRSINQQTTRTLELCSYVVVARSVGAVQHVNDVAAADRKRMNVNPLGVFLRCTARSYHCVYREVTNIHPGPIIASPCLLPSSETPRYEFDAHVTVLHRDNFLTIKPTRCTNFSKFYFGMKLYMFRTVSLFIIRRFPLYIQQWYMSYRFADRLRAGSGWNCSSIPQIS